MSIVNAKPSTAMSVVRHVNFHTAHSFAASAVTSYKSDNVDPAVAASKPFSTQLGGICAYSIRVRSMVNTTVFKVIATVVMIAVMVMLAEPVR